MIRTKRNILFIQGVFASRCNADEIIEEKYNYDLDEVTEIDDWDKPPSRFTDRKSWPNGLNILCNTCGLSCSNKIIGIPLIFERPKKPHKYNIIMEGAFDSWPCLARYIKYELPHLDLRINIKTYYKAMTGVDRHTELVPCTRPRDMVQFGGTLTPDEWTKINADTNEEYEKYILDIPEVTKNTNHKNSADAEYTLTHNDSVVEKLY